MSGIPELLTTRGIARALGVPFTTLQNNLPKLRRDHGFPKPLPGMGGRYDPLAIAEWRRKQAGIADLVQAPAPIETAASEDLAGWAAELDRRALQIGRAGGRA